MEASSAVADFLTATRPERRATALRELLAHTAAGIVILEGESEAAEATYRLADAIVSRRQAAGAEQ